MCVCVWKIASGAIKSLRDTSVADCGYAEIFSFSSFVYLLLFHFIQIYGYCFAIEFGISICQRYNTNCSWPISITLFYYSKTRLRKIATLTFYHVHTRTAACRNLNIQNKRTRQRRRDNNTAEESSRKRQTLARAHVRNERATHFPHTKLLLSPFSLTLSFYPQRSKK